MNYKVEYHYSIDKLIEVVEGYIELGYEPLGGPFVFNQRIGQALTKKEPPPKQETRVGAKTSKKKVSKKKAIPKKTSPTRT